MNTLRKITTICIFIILGTLGGGQALAGDFIDTRVTFTLGDDNFLKDAGEQVPDSPMLSIGDREGYELFFDNLDSRTSGRENQMNLVLYKKAEGILPGLTTEAAATLRFGLVESTFEDDSSYIRLQYAIDRARRGEKNLELVLFPLSGDRFRVGYLYALTWGGTDMFPRKKLGSPSPALKLGGNHGKFYWWGGMKLVAADTAPSESKNEQGQTISTQNLESFYSALAGFGLKPIDGLDIDFNGAYIQMGENPIKDVAGELVTATGFSGRITYSQGIKVMLSSDIRLRRADPEYLESLSKRPRYKPGQGLAWRLSLEGSAIAQTLADPDKYGGTKNQWASNAALDFRMQYDYLRFNLTAMYRSMEFILLNTPSYVPFQAFPKEADIQPNFFAALSGDYHFPRWGLTPGLQVGIEMPAAVTTTLTAMEVGSNAPPTLIGRHTIVIRSNGRPDILPEGKDRAPQFSVRHTTKWFASDFLTLMFFAYLTYDQNVTILQVNPDRTNSRIFEDPVRVGAGFTAQARF